MPSRAQTREGISPVHSLVLLQLRDPACTTTDHCRSTRAAGLPRTKIGGYKKLSGSSQVRWQSVSTRSTGTQKLLLCRAATWCGTRLASETVGSATTTRRHFRPRCQRVSRTRDEFSLLRVCQDQVVQPVGGDPDEFSDTETHCVAKKPERDRHSIFSGG